MKCKTQSYRTFRKKSKTGRNLQGPGLVNRHDVKNMAHQRKKINKLNLINTKYFWSEKAQVKRMKKIIFHVCVCVSPIIIVKVKNQTLVRMGGVGPLMYCGVNIKR